MLSILDSVVSTLNGVGVLELGHSSHIRADLPRVELVSRQELLLLVKVVQGILGGQGLAMWVQSDVRGDFVVMAD